MRRLSLSLQRDKHDPVRVTRRLYAFTSAMSKLRLIIENPLDEDDDEQVKTSFKTFCSKVENDDGEFCYHSIKLAKYELTIKRALSNLCTKAEQRLSSFAESVAFQTFCYCLTLNYG